MPELPEVETVVRGLRSQILKKTVKDVFISDKKLRIPYPKNLVKEIKGRQINDISRRSKYILMQMSNGKILVLHLGMSGRILYKERKAETQKHDHFIIEFSDKTEIIFNDPRRFGLITLVNTEEMETHKLFKDLGAEPLEKEFDGKYLQKVFKGKAQSVKQALMDSRNLVGVGNIYASEALFRAGINPKKEAGKINLKSLEKLAKDVQIVLRAAIKSGGSTLRDYVRSDGDVGYFQHSFKVYGRKNEPCFNCETPLIKIVQQGRSTFYCPSCQK